VRKADIWGSRRYLKSIPEDERSQIEAHTTIWYKDQQSHLIQRTKALEHSFAKQRNALQWDEKTIAHVAWTGRSFRSRACVLDCIGSAR
jgi:hypothetical protein